MYKFTLLIILFLFYVADEYTKVPLPTVHPPAKMLVDMNTTAKLYCEAFLGEYTHK